MFSSALHIKFMMIFAAMPLHCHPLEALMYVRMDMIESCCHLVLSEKSLTTMLRSDGDDEIERQ